jgi:hypothetical protein
MIARFIGTANGTSWHGFPADYRRKKTGQAGDYGFASLAGSRLHPQARRIQDKERQAMRPVKLTIPGDYWDSKIYRGRLYLWDMENALRVYDWDALVHSLLGDERIELPLLCSFTRGGYLYHGGDWSLVFNDQDVRHLLESKFQSLASLQLEIGPPTLSSFLLAQQDNPFGTMHDDSEVYTNHLYGINDSGLSSVEVHNQRRRKRIVKNEAHRLWDGQGTSIRAGANSLAVAAADEGLFEIPIPVDGVPTRDQPRSNGSTNIQLSSRHTLFANWAFASIYGSSDVEDSYLAAFEWRKEAEDEGRPRWERHFSRLVDAQRIFGQGGLRLSWGFQEKLYQPVAGGLRVTRFAQENIPLEEEGEAFSEPEFIPFQVWKDEIIGGGATFFGAIVECENALVVLRSDGEVYNLPGAVARWRVFPRSTRYVNQLHVIYEDRLEIHSFNHDYFIDQRTKNLGVEHRTRTRWFM